MKKPTKIIYGIVAIVAVAGLSFGAFRAYAYHHAQAVISTAKSLEAQDDFDGSYRVLSNLKVSSLTRKQQGTVSELEAQDQKFKQFQTSFNLAVAAENGSPSVSSLATALKALQSIDPSYPDYANVQSETAKVQSSLSAAESKLREQVSADEQSSFDNSPFMQTLNMLTGELSQNNAVASEWQLVEDVVNGQTLSQSQLSSLPAYDQQIVLSGNRSEIEMLARSLSDEVQSGYNSYQSQIGVHPTYTAPVSNNINCYSTTSDSLFGRTNTTTNCY